MYQDRNGGCCARCAERCIPKKFGDAHVSFRRHGGASIAQNSRTGSVHPAAFTVASISCTNQARHKRPADFQFAPERTPQCKPQSSTPLAPQAAYSASRWWLRLHCLECVRLGPIQSIRVDWVTTPLFYSAWGIWSHPRCSIHRIDPFDNRRLRSLR